MQIDIFSFLEIYSISKKYLFFGGILQSKPQEVTLKNEKAKKAEWLT